MSPYKKFKDCELILRDELAIDRTLLANERTLLAYLRSGVALILGGVTFIHFAQEDWYKVVGLFCIPMGFLAMVFGTLRFFLMNRTISSARRQCKTESNSEA